MMKVLKWVTFPLWFLPALALIVLGYCLGKIVDGMDKYQELR